MFREQRVFSFSVYYQNKYCQTSVIDKRIVLINRILSKQKYPDAIKYHYEIKPLMNLVLNFYSHRSSVRFIMDHGQICDMLHMLPTILIAEFHELMMRYTEYQKGKEREKFLKAIEFLFANNSQSLMHYLFRGEQKRVVENTKILTSEIVPKAKQLRIKPRELAHLNKAKGSPSNQSISKTLNALCREIQVSQKDSHRQIPERKPKGNERSSKFGREFYENIRGSNKNLNLEIKVSLGFDCKINKNGSAKFDCSAKKNAPEVQLVRRMSQEDDLSLTDCFFSRQNNPIDDSIMGCSSIHIQQSNSANKILEPGGQQISKSHRENVWDKEKCYKIASSTNFEKKLKNPKAVERKLKLDNAAEGVKNSLFQRKKSSFKEMIYINANSGCSKELVSTFQTDLKKLKQPLKERATVTSFKPEPEKALKVPKLNLKVVETKNSKPSKIFCFSDRRKTDTLLLPTKRSSSQRKRLSKADLRLNTKRRTVHEELKIKIKPFEPGKLTARSLKNDDFFSRRYPRLN
jgi:hypothetical protein